jgi:hypothetical protein
MTRNARTIARTVGFQQDKTIAEVRSRAFDFANTASKKDQTYRLEYTVFPTDAASQNDPMASDESGNLRFQ